MEETPGSFGEQNTQFNGSCILFWYVMSLLGWYILSEKECSVSIRDLLMRSAQETSNT